MPKSLAEFSEQVAVRSGEPLLFAVAAEAPGGWASTGVAAPLAGLGALFGIGGILIGSAIGGVAMRLHVDRAGLAGCDRCLGVG